LDRGDGGAERDDAHSNLNLFKYNYLVAVPPFFSISFMDLSHSKWIENVSPLSLKQPFLQTDRRPLSFFLSFFLSFSSSSSDLCSLLFVVYVGCRRNKELYKAITRSIWAREQLYGIPYQLRTLWYARYTRALYQHSGKQQCNILLTQLILSFEPSPSTQTAVPRN
jgi:hypothetical protein